MREIKDILAGKDIITYTKSFRLRWFGHVERLQNPRIAK
jgi:hypothetical protein